VCETILDDEAMNEQDLASTAYDAGWKDQKLMNPKGFKEGTFQLAVCGECIAKTEGAK